jgi:hypothetical protein
MHGKLVLDPGYWKAVEKLHLKGSTTGKAFAERPRNPARHVNRKASSPIAMKLEKRPRVFDNGMVVLDLGYWKAVPYLHLIEPTTGKSFTPKGQTSLQDMSTARRVPR